MNGVLRADDNRITSYNVCYTKLLRAKSGVHNNQPKGAIVGGIPAIEVKKWGRAAAASSRLPEMVKEVRRLRKEMEQLKAQLDTLEQLKANQG